MRTVCLFITLLFLVAVPGLVFAETAHEFIVKGYELNFKWEHKINLEHQDAFEIIGTATKGDPCKNLEVQVAFSNDHYKDYTPVAKAYIQNYQPDTLNEFRGETVVKTESQHLPSWGVIDYTVNCLE